MRTISATFKIVTPMFLGDVDQQARSLRPSSLKGALRFWWRALRWAQAMQVANNGAPMAMRWLHSREAQLFGAAASDEAGGQGVFLMQVRADRMTSHSQPINAPGPGLRYLLGQGLFKDDCTRSALAAGQSFELLIRFKPATLDSDCQELVATLRAFGLFGALGSRARHGMGSVVLTDLTIDGQMQEVPGSVESYCKAVRQLLDGTDRAGLPLYTAFSKQAMVEISADDSNALRLLDRVGGQQQLYRSWGRAGKVNGQEARRLFGSDHDTMLRAAHKENVSTAPARAVFGLPHNYYFSVAKKTAEVNALIENSGDAARRASPLLLHIHPVNGGTSFIAVHTLLPAMFLPPTGGILIQKQRQVLPAKVKWSVIYNYLSEYQKDAGYRKIVAGERIND